MSETDFQHSLERFELELASGRSPDVEALLASVDLANPTDVRQRAEIVECLLSAVGVCIDGSFFKAALALLARADDLLERFGLKDEFSSRFEDLQSEAMVSFLLSDGGASQNADGQEHIVQAIAALSKVIERRQREGVSSTSLAYDVRRLAALSRLKGDEKSASDLDSKALSLESLREADFGRPVDRANSLDAKSAQGHRGQLSASQDTHQLVSVFYATDRVRSTSSSLSRFYSDEIRAEGLEYGVAQVSVPQLNDRRSSLPKPQIWRGEFRADASLHVILKRIGPLGEGAQGRALFQDAARAALEASAGREVLVYVHGYRNTFISAVSRGAQLAADLEISGVPIVFSWASSGSTLRGYFADSDAVGQALANKLADFLESLSAELNPSVMHIVAHSMGNRLVLLALQTIAARRSEDDKRPRFGEFVAASADVGRSEFEARYEGANKLISASTMYCSQRDLALAASEWLSTRKRAGQGVAMAGIDMVDTSEAGNVISNGLIRHDDFAGIALDDLRAVIWHGVPPGTLRPWLKKDNTPHNSWLLMQPTAWGHNQTAVAKVLYVARLENIYGADHEWTRAARAALQEPVGGWYEQRLAAALSLPRETRRVTPS